MRIRAQAKLPQVRFAEEAEHPVFSVRVDAPEVHCFFREGCPHQLFSPEPS
jgi:hypothetical protein